MPKIVKKTFIPVITICLLLSACGEQAEPEPPKAVMPRASVYEGKIIRQPGANRGREDGWFLVKNGKRHWITHGDWLAKNGHGPNSVIEISAKDFNAIREDTPL